MKNIDIHIDFSCPFSYLGGENFIQYLEKNDLLGKVEPNFISFRLSPDKDNINTNFLKNMTVKFHKSSIDETRLAYKSIIGMGSQLGLKYDVENLIDTNSLMAHRGLQFVKEQGGNQLAYFRMAMKAHWELAQDFSSLEVIGSILKELGYDVEAFTQRFEALDNAIQTDVKLARERRVNSVPTFVSGGRSVSGVGTPQDFKNIVA